MEHQKKDLGRRATDAMVEFVHAFAGIAARLLDEEKLPTRDLPGYAECRRKVRYRLLPGYGDG
ncbi:hypothetical protein [Rhizobium ruizarguesonis]|jgi:hypothetical protein|uniref:hypothetical protein n=1 Tax=Rhizobium ruizarguesonis TaxID=2081791 RepID=UPI001031F14A|nr:hypothetical protein [Rhizobium ruizarguesonis]MBY5842366.1 hypothetical protein [Rhizobium leguminosarum]TBY95049.1 hypothetical protein E0H40_01285 [Rhizobium leguminosarum bv. viciae]NEH83380.1 hypothetical protein [Rhizobium ruizarguesonis]NEI15286.1 hypothetical protein [Rhizobium ruizarguesonis]NEJ56386.1 hypothetical protein [Rhizobium ruizarguesonis]